MGVSRNMKLICIELSCAEIMTEVKLYDLESYWNQMNVLEKILICINILNHINKGKDSKSKQYYF